MVIFNSYVKLPEGIFIINHSELGVMFTNLAIKRGPHIVSTFAFGLHIFNNTCFLLAHSLGSCKSLLWNMFHDDDTNDDLPIGTYSNMGENLQVALTTFSTMGSRQWAVL